MATRYPTYDSENRKTLAPLQNIDRADLREEVKGANAMAQGASKIMNFAFNKLDKKAKKEGMEYGATNPQEAMKSTKDGSTTFDEYAYGAAVKVASAEIETEARNEMSKALLEWKDTKGDPELLKQKLFNINAGFSNAMGDMDAISAAALNQSLTRVSNSAYLNYTEGWMKENKEKLKTANYLALDERFKSVEIMARGHISPQLFDENLLAEIEGTTVMLEAGDHSPKEIASAVLTLTSKAHKARVRSAFLRTEDKAGFINEFEKDFSKREGSARGLGEQESLALLSEMNTKMGTLKTVRNSLLKSLDGEFTGLEKIAVDGLENGPQLADLKNRARESGHSELYMKIEMLEENYETYYRPARLMSPENLTKEINKIQIAQTADNNVTEEEKILVDNLEKILTDLKSDRSDEEKDINERYSDIASVVADGNNPGFAKLEAMMVEAKDLGYEDMYEDLSKLLSSTKVLQRANQMSQEKLRKEINDIKAVNKQNKNTSKYASDLIRNLESIHSKKVAGRKDEDAVLDEYLGIIEAGYRPNEELQGELNDVLIRYKDTEIRDKIKQVIVTRAKMDMAEDLNVNQLDKVITNMETVANKVGADNESKALIDNLKTLKINMENNLKQDPVAWAKTTREDFPELLYITKNGKTIIDPDSAIRRYKWMDSWSAEMGIERSILTNEEKDGMIALYNTVNKDQKMNILIGMEQSFGIRTLDVLEEIHHASDEGSMLAHLGYLGAGNNKEILSDTLSGMELAKVDVEAYFKDKPGALAIIKEETNALTSGARFPPHLLGNIAATAKAAYTKRHMDQGLDEFDQTLWERTLQEASGAIYINKEQHGGMVTFEPRDDGKEHQVMIPENIKADEFEDLIDSIDSVDFMMITRKDGNLGALHFIDKKTGLAVPLDITADSDDLDDESGEDKFGKIRDRWHFSNIDENNVRISLRASTNYDLNNQEGIGFYVDSEGKPIVINLRELKIYMDKKNNTPPNFIQ